MANIKDETKTKTKMQPQPTIPGLTTPPIGMQTVPSPTALPKVAPTPVDQLQDPVAKELRDYQASGKVAPSVADTSKLTPEDIRNGLQLFQKTTGMTDESRDSIIGMENAKGNVRGNILQVFPKTDAVAELAKIAVPPKTYQKSGAMEGPQNRADGTTPTTIGQGVGGESVSGQAKTKEWDWMDVARKLAEMAQAGIYGYTGSNAPLAYRERQAREKAMADQTREDSLRKDELDRMAKEKEEERAYGRKLTEEERAYKAKELEKAQAWESQFRTGGTDEEIRKARAVAQIAKQNAVPTGGALANTLSMYGE